MKFYFTKTTSIVPPDAPIVSCTSPDRRIKKLFVRDFEAYASRVEEKIRSEKIREEGNEIFLN